MALAEEARMKIVIDLAGNASAGVARLNKQLGTLQKGVGRAGKGVGQIGAGLTRAGLLVGGAAVAGITAAAKAAIDFEDAFAGIRKTVDERELKAAGLSFEILSDSIRKMATDIPITAVELAKIGETAGALGIRAQDITIFTETMAKLGVTTDLTADQAADGIGRISTILDLTGPQIVEISDSIVALGNAGASTESEIVEITKRFAAEAKAAGLAKEDIVGLASATASLGFAPERGGTALARVFANMSTNIATANSKGKALAKGLGRGVKSLQSQIDKGGGLDIFMDVLEEIRDMSPTQAARFLKSIGVTNVSDRTIFRTMADQLPFVNEQLEIARKAQGALLREAEKKFATTASKIQLFKNNLIETGIAMGEQFLPAVGRALDKLITAFKDPDFKNEVIQLGKDIGAAIDRVDWNEVLTQARELTGVLKGAAGWAKRLFDAFNALPGPIKEATAGFLVLDKLSGGLLHAGAGNIFGGIAETIARSLGSQLPGAAGRLFVQPVLVTNWPVGFGAGGVPGAAPAGKGPGGLTGVATTIFKGLGVVFLAQIADDIHEAIKPATPPPASDLSWPWGPKNTPSILPKLEIGGVKLTGPNGILGGTPAGGALPQAHVGAMGDPGAFKTLTASVDNTKTAVNTVGTGVAAVSTNVLGTKTQVATTGTMIMANVRGSSQSNAAIIAGATRSSASAIIGAIYAARPIINTTHVTRNTTIQQRYGPGNGSAGNNGPGASGV